jgi:hypothetical protein
MGIWNLALIPDKSRAAQVVSSQWLSKEAMNRMMDWGIRSPLLLTAYQYAPRTNQVLVLNLKCAASTALKRLQLCELQSIGQSNDVSGVVSQLGTEIWNPSNRISYPLNFSGLEFEITSRSAVWTSTCRNPFSRVCSSFLHMRLIGVIPRNETLDGFLTYLGNQRRLLSNRHWIPQTRVLTPPVMQRLDHLVPFESLEDGHMGPEWFQSPESVTDHGQEGVSELMESFSPTVIRKILSIYQADFDQFGYSHDPKDSTKAPHVVVGRRP